MREGGGGVFAGHYGTSGVHAENYKVHETNKTDCMFTKAQILCLPHDCGSFAYFHSS